MTEAKLRAAIGTVKPDRGERHDELAAALAKELGVSAAKVQRRVRQAPRRRAAPAPATARTARPTSRRRSASPRPSSSRPSRTCAGASAASARSARTSRGADLAKALGISQAKVDAAFEKLRAAHEAEHQKMRDALAASLAKSLNLDEAKVKAALDDFAPERGGHPHP